jgi:cold shock CspA family protein
MDAKKPGRERALEITQADGSPIGDVPPAHLGGGGGGNGGGGNGAAPGYAAGGYSGAPARGNTSTAGKSAGTVKIWNDEKGFGFIDPMGTRSTATSRALIAVGCVCSPCARPVRRERAHNVHRWHACKRATGAGGGENVFVHRANVIGTDNRPVLARGMQVVPSSSLPPSSATADPLHPLCCMRDGACSTCRVACCSGQCALLARASLMRTPSARFSAAALTRQAIIRIALIGYPARHSLPSQQPHGEPKCSLS